MKSSSKKIYSAVCLAVTGAAISLASFGVFEVLGAVVLKLTGVSP